MDKQTSLPLFHFLLCQLIAECSQQIKQTEDYNAEIKLRQIGSQMGYKLYNQICLKRGITERPSNILELIKNIKTKVFKHLFNYELSAQNNFYAVQQKRTVVYGIVDQISVYLTWMPQNCWITASMLIAGIIEGICVSSDIKCCVTCRIPQNNEERTIIEYLIQLSEEQHDKWNKK